jgi:hypothetical protein
MQFVRLLRVLNLILGDYASIESRERSGMGCNRHILYETKEIIMRVGLSRSLAASDPVIILFAVGFRSAPAQTVYKEKQMVEIADALKSLLDTWYKAVMCLGAGVLVASLFFPVHGLTNQECQGLSGGAFLIGLGEWKNHKWCISYYSTCRITDLVRKPDLFGVSCEIAGAVLIVVEILKIASG